MKGQSVAPLWQLDNDRILNTLRRVILEEFRPQTPRLYAYQRIEMGIKVCRPPEHLGGNLVFLERYPGMLDCIIR